MSRSFRHVIKIATLPLAAHYITLSSIAAPGSPWLDIHRSSSERNLALAWAQAGSLARLFVGIGIYPVEFFSRTLVETLLQFLRGRIPPA
jgi:hypothetical protein